MSASPSADSRRSRSLEPDFDDHEHDFDTTPLSGSASASGSGSGSGNQSTKDRRRERNRLAAQKHRLRRNERMAQLEAQVLALQQDKAMLVARLDSRFEREDPPSSSPRASANAPYTSPPDLQEVEMRERKRPRTADPEPLPPATTTAAYRSPPSPTGPTLPPLNSPPPPPSSSTSAAHESTVRLLESRIHELEAYTSSLASELSSHLQSTSGTLDRLHRLTSERAQTLSELSAAHASLARFRSKNDELTEQNMRLREEMEGAEVALDLQRVENERLRERVGKEEREGREGRDECRRLRRALREVEDDAATAHAEADAIVAAQASRLTSFKREEPSYVHQHQQHPRQQWDSFSHHHDSQRSRVQQIESAERDRRLVSVR